MTKVCIESATCLIPRRGTQEERRRLRDEFRHSHPEEAADLEKQPFYLDPDSSYASDDWAVCEWEWSTETNQQLTCTRTFIHISEVPKLKPVTLGPVIVHEADEWCEFSFNFKASYAVAVLKSRGHIPADSVSWNENDAPMDFDTEALEEEAA